MNNSLPNIAYEVKAIRDSGLLGASRVQMCNGRLQSALHCHYVMSSTTPDIVRIWLLVTSYDPRKWRRTHVRTGGGSAITERAG